ncbi:MAG TPA: hypothetical protein ENN63_06835 [Bacteroidetes bacterium]|nr:hypothetical protein [Bacteroidota bacterium]
MIRLQRPRTILSIFLLLFLASCHSDYLSLSYKIHHSAAWNDDHTRIALFITTKAFRAPKGIARFPDGGISKTVYTETSLYLFEPDTKSIYKTGRLENFPVQWNIKIAFSDSLVYYSVSPPTEWEQKLENAETESDSLKIYALKEAYSHPFVFNERTKEISRADSSTFSRLYSEERKADIQPLYNQINEVPLSELGLVLQEIYPKPAKEYINDFISSSKGGSALTKRAIAEQIIAPLSKSEIRSILKSINEYGDNLEGLEKQEYEFYSEDKIKLLKKLL